MFGGCFVWFSEIVSSHAQEIYFHEISPIQISRVEIISFRVLWMHQWHYSHAVLCRILEVFVQKEVESFGPFVKYTHEFQTSARHKWKCSKEINRNIQRIWENCVRLTCGAEFQVQAIFRANTKASLGICEIRRRRVCVSSHFESSHLVSIPFWGLDVRQLFRSKCLCILLLIVDSGHLTCNGLLLEYLVYAYRHTSPMQLTNWLHNRRESHRFSTHHCRILFGISLS